MLVQIPDEVALRYQAAADATRQPLQKILERQLTKFAAVPTHGKLLVLSGTALDRLDQLLGLGATTSAEAFVRAVEGWAGITIGGIRVDFPPAQLAEIQHRAEVQGKTPEAIVEDIVAQLSREFFNSPVVAR